MTSIAEFLTSNYTTIQLRRRASKMGLTGLSSSKKTVLVPAIVAKIDADRAEAVPMYVEWHAQFAVKTVNCETCGAKVDRSMDGRDGYTVTTDHGTENEHECKTIAQEVAEVVAESAKPKHSRAGQVMEVRPMTEGLNKANTVREKLMSVGVEAQIDEAAEAHEADEAGVVGESLIVLEGEGFRIAWYLDGQYAYNETSLTTPKGSRKIRNASDLLRVKGYKK